MYGFERLIKKMDEIAGRIDEEVIIQIGSTNYVPENARYFRFASKEDIDQLYERSGVVVCHAGVGSILTALEHGKPVIAVPRRKEYGEAVDEHQVDISRELEKEGRITVVYDVCKLEDMLTNRSAESAVKAGKNKKLVRALREYILSLSLTK